MLSFFQHDPGWLYCCRLLLVFFSTHQHPSCLVDVIISWISIDGLTGSQQHTFFFFFLQYFSLFSSSVLIPCFMKRKSAIQCRTSFSVLQKLIGTMFSEERLSNFSLNRGRMLMSVALVHHCFHYMLESSTHSGASGQIEQYL